MDLISYAQSPNRSDALIEWAAEHFPQACFLLYEQVHPEDPFGRVMQQHFRQLNTALRSLAQYPDCKAQQRRFLGKVSACSPRVGCARGIIYLRMIGTLIAQLWAEADRAEAKLLPSLVA